MRFRRVATSRGRSAQHLVSRSDPRASLRSGLGGGVAEVGGFELGGVVAELLGWSLEGDLSVDHDEGFVGDFEGEADVLFYEHDGGLGAVGDLANDGHE